MERRTFLANSALAGASLLTGNPIVSASSQQNGFSPKNDIAKEANLSIQSHVKKMVILGMDGMDPRLMQQFVEEGVMPNFKKLIDEGDFKPLQTSASPQSPIAWSTFITGMDSGGHNIFDFVHRDPKTMMPFASLSKTTAGEHNLNVGSWVLPLSSGKVENQRKGKAFWQVMSDHGIPSIVFQMPANFPPVEAKGFSLSGMGTPDITGNSCSFSYYTDLFPKNAAKYTGGKAYKVSIRNNRIDSTIHGPINSFRREIKQSSSGISHDEKVEYENPECIVDFTIFIDRKAKAAKFVLPNQEFILKEGEWSEWKKIDFKAAPWSTISSIGRFYLKGIDPQFKLYLSSLHINPENPALPISQPAEWSKELFEQIGYFHTKELPADTKALTYDVLSGKDFWDQTISLYNESRRALEYLLEKHETGMLFFYFSSLDQGCHMLRRYMDKEHPGYVQDEFLLNGIRDLYIKMDEALGFVRNKIDEETTLIVMSDHGFGPFYWGVNLNSWLLHKGYITLKNPSATIQEEALAFQNVDWQKTKGYAYGLNCLYVNLQGREQEGCVPPEEYDTLIDQLKKDLLEMVDPRNNINAISQVVIPRREFHGLYKDQGADIIVGYNWGYRSSWENPLGQMPKEIFVDNSEAWSGDHCVDNRLVPGILVTNKKITLDKPALYDLTIGVLNQFGLEPLPEMIGKNCLGA